MFAYIISCTTVDFIKIGITTDPQRRLTELQTNSPYTLRIALLIECNNLATAQRLEKLLHELMHASRSNGEWFHASVSTAVEYAEMLLSISGNISLIGEGKQQGITTQFAYNSKHNVVKAWFCASTDRLSLSCRKATELIKSEGIDVGHVTVNNVRRSLLLVKEYRG